jgi:hypothetical protein
MGFWSSVVGIIGVIAAPFTGGASLLLTAAAVVAPKVVDAVMDFVMSPFMPSIPNADAGAAAQREQGVLIQRQGSTVSIPIIYGFRKVGGIVTFAETGSASNKYLWVAYVFSEGLVEGLHGLSIDDVELPVDQMANLNAGEQVTVNAGKYKDRVKLLWFPGLYYDLNTPRGQAQNDLRSLINVLFMGEAPSWNQNMTYNGLAVLFARFEWIATNDNSNPFTGNIPKMQATILGKRVASLLVDSTENISYDQTETRYSTNPAECLLDYLRNPRYGKGLFNTDIDWTTWRAAARKYNQTVTYLSGRDAITGPIMTLNMVVDTNSSIMTNVKSILENTRSYMPYVQGKYKLRVEDAGNDTDILSGVATIVNTFNKDNIVSDITYNGIERSSKYNVVAVTYVDPDQKWETQTVIYPESEAERQVYIDQDGGRENKKEITFGAITNYAIAKDMARLVFNKQRRQDSCVFTATSEALELEPGDCIRIQSNQLNFGTAPWRIISVKVNNDMTVSLGCVRNPDDIYPYTRVGEEDLVLPTYVPKGSIIYFPSSNNETPLGLVPPLYAVFPPNTTPIATNPAPTDPNGPTGGGVGGGSPGGGTGGPVTVEPTTPPTTPVPPTNVVPVPPPRPVDFAGILTFRRVSIIDQGNGTSVFNIIFTQPLDALYHRSTFWWRLNASSNFIAIESTSRPGAGGEITFSVTLPSTNYTPYEYYVRSYASDGRASTSVLRGTFQITVNQSTGALVGGGSSVAILNSPGWTLPSTATPVVARYDDTIGYFAIQPNLPSDPRRLTVKIQQLTDTVNNNLNPLINGFVVFWRFKTDTYWNKEVFTYPGGYTFGQLTYQLAGAFGVRGAVGSLQQYEFFVRLTYSDGTVAQRQLGPVAAPVETSPTGLTTYDIIGTSPYAATQTTSQDIASTFTFLTTDQNPNNAFAVGSDIVPVLQVQVNTVTGSLIFVFSPPTNSKFAGYRIRCREVVAGTSPAFNTYDIGPAKNSAGKIETTVIGVIGKTYEWVVTAKYLTTAGAVQDATNSLYGKILVPTGDSTWGGIDIYSRIFTGVQPVLTSLALGNLRATFPALPTVNPLSWNKIQGRPNTYGGAEIGGVDPLITPGNDAYYAGAGNYYLNAYYQLKFQADSTSDRIVIYRRVYDAGGITKTTTTDGFAKYRNLGAWEKTTVLLSSLTTDAAGWKTLNVRGPIAPSLFDPRYEVTAGKTLYDARYGPSPGKFPLSSSTPSTTKVYPYYGVGNSPVSTTRTRYAEFVFVLATSAAEQTKGLRLTEFNAVNISAGFQASVNGFSANVPKDDVVTISDFNTIASSYGRRISEALTGITISASVSDPQLFLGNPNYGQIGVPQYPTTSPTYSHFLKQPQDGNTVY